MTRPALFAAIRPYAPSQRFTPQMVAVIDQLADMMGMAREGGPLTARGAAELVAHEGIVLEAYLDTSKVWTWGVGITKASGIDPLQYKDKPSTLDVALRASVDRLNKVYVPDVLDAFGGRGISEAQFAAAVSFHYNTGAIKRTDWVRLWLAGDIKGARTFLETHYLNGGVLADRRKKEAALFFDGKWDSNGTASVIPVSKPSYQPRFGGAMRVDVLTPLKGIMGA